MAAVAILIAIWFVMSAIGGCVEGLKELQEERSTDE